MPVGELQVRHGQYWHISACINPQPVPIERSQVKIEQFVTAATPTYSAHLES